MKQFTDKKARRFDLVQNLAIVLLTLSAGFLFASLPLFGALSDRSLVELAREHILNENARPEADAVGVPALAFPVRIVYANGFSRIGVDAITTLSDEFERAGTFLGEAIGSAYDEEAVTESEFLDALSGRGLYFDFTAALPFDVLSGSLGVSASETELANARRMLLCPTDAEEAVFYAQDGAGKSSRFSTAVSSAALDDFLAARSGSGADFAFMLGDDYARLSPYTLVLSVPAPRGTLTASNAVSGNEDTILHRAEFNAHTENRFTESSGSVIVREASSMLYLRPDGTVDYAGGAVEPDSLYFVAASDPAAPTASEAAAAAQRLISALLQDLLGDAAIYLSGVSAGGGRVEIRFDLMADGTPIRLPGDAHAARVTVEGQSITAFTLNARSYTYSEEPSLLLPFAQAAAIARVWDGAELATVYLDTGTESVQPAWIAES